MIDPEHDLPIQKQAEVLQIGRSTVYYEPRPVPEPDLWLEHLSYCCRAAKGSRNHAFASSSLMSGSSSAMA